jgi:hypothetical protein
MAGRERHAEAIAAASRVPTDDEIEAAEREYQAQIEGGVRKAIPRERIDAIAAATEEALPTHEEVVAKSFPGASVRRPEFVEGLPLATARGLAAMAADDPDSRIRALDWLARVHDPRNAVLKDPTTGRPVLRRSDGTVLTLDVPGFLQGGAEATGEVFEAFGQSVFGEAGAVAGARVAPGHPIFALPFGAMTFEGIRQGLGWMTGLDSDEVDSMISTIGVEGLGQFLPIIAPRIWRKTFGAAGGRLSERAERALASEIELEKAGFKFGLTPGEIVPHGPLGYMSRQAAMLDGSRNEIMTDRLPRLTQWIDDLADSTHRDRLREYIVADFGRTLEQSEAGILEASRAVLIHPYGWRDFAKRWESLLTGHRKNTQTAVSAAYRRANELMANAGMRENYFAPNGRGWELFDTIKNIRTRHGTPHPRLNRLMREMEEEVSRAQEQGVSGMLDTTKRAQNPLSGEVFERTVTVREKLQTWAEQLYDVSADEAVPKFTRGQAREVRKGILDTLNSPVFEPIPGRPADLGMAREASVQHEAARTMARERFESLELLDNLGLTPKNPRPKKVVEGIVEARSLDDIHALARVHGGLEAVRDVFFTQLHEAPEQAGDLIMDLVQGPPGKRHPEFLLEILGRDRNAFARVTEQARRIQQLRETGAFDALAKEAREINFAGKLLFGGDSTQRKALLEEIGRRGGASSPLGRAAEAAVIEELLSRTFHATRPGVEISPQAYKRMLYEMQKEGTLDFVNPRTRDLLFHAEAVATYANISRPDAGTSLEVKSTAARLRSGKVWDAIKELGAAKGLALVLANPKATAMFANAARSGDPTIVWDLTMGALGMIALRALAQESPEGAGAQPAGIE